MRSAVVLSFACLAAAAAVGCGQRAGLTGGGAADGGVDIPPGATPVTSAAPLPPPTTTPTAAAPATSALVRSQPVSFAPIAQAADPSVVTIRTEGEEVEVSPFTHRSRPRQTEGLGTGFVIDKSGVI